MSKNTTKKQKEEKTRQEEEIRREIEIFSRVGINPSAPIMTEPVTDAMLSEWHNQTKESEKKGGKKTQKRTWSKKYKASINCKRPKGFSQKQYCKYGRNKSNKSK